MKCHYRETSVVIICKNRKSDRETVLSLHFFQSSLMTMYSIVDMLRMSTFFFSCFSTKKTACFLGPPFILSLAFFFFFSLSLFILSILSPVLSVPPPLRRPFSDHSTFRNSPRSVHNCKLR